MTTTDQTTTVAAALAEVTRTQLAVAEAFAAYYFAHDQVAAAQRIAAPAKLAIDRARSDAEAAESNLRNVAIAAAAMRAEAAS